jgi:hypothetical protein
MINEKISESLGLNPNPVLEGEVIEAKEIMIVGDSTSNNDFNIARENIHELIQKGQESLDLLMQLAQQSQQPRAFEVISTMINTLVGANKEMMDLHKKKQDLDGDKDAGPKNVTNNLIVGTTKDILRLMKGKKGIVNDKESQ